MDVDINEMYNYWDYEFLMTTDHEDLGNVCIYKIKTSAGYSRFICFKARYVSVEEFRFVLPLIKLNLHPNTIIG